MKLYYAPQTISIAVAIALHEAGVEYTPVMLNFPTGEQGKPDYLAINPKGRVPAIVTQQGILTETGALLDYVAALAPKASLVPDDPFKAAQMRAVMYYLASTMHVNHAHRVRGQRWADQQSSFDDMAQKTPQTMTESCRFIEDHALQGPYVMGDEITLADCYLFIVSTWLEGDGVDLDAFPKITGFRELMNSRASVITAREMGML
ncbi:Glutathione S-transferase [hydrothermal vent metagenome]|uniref:Glutathione S-transferase n=1 Tax=hydrothermal vent metagenome TaxID=652676 RepID=A0A3B0SMZ2_9ZZZZ